MTKMNIKHIAFFLILGVVLSVALYAVLLIYATWPISELSISKAGVFGDSFGLLTSLFSGLAFSGVIITILLQREELQLQRQELSENRKEFSKSANAQERSAQLSALSALLNECELQLKKKEESLENSQYLKNDSSYRHLLEDPDQLKQEIYSLTTRKTAIMVRIEEILKSTGVNLGKT
jgi:hypothetical protein